MFIQSHENLASEDIFLHLQNLQNDESIHLIDINNIDQIQEKIENKNIDDDIHNNIHNENNNDNKSNNININVNNDILNENKNEVETHCYYEFTAVLALSYFILFFIASILLLITLSSDSDFNNIDTIERNNSTHSHIKSHVRATLLQACFGPFGGGYWYIGRNELALVETLLTVITIFYVSYYSLIFFYPSIFNCDIFNESRREFLQLQNDDGNENNSPIRRIFNLSVIIFSWHFVSTLIFATNNYNDGNGNKLY